MEHKGLEGLAHQGLDFLFIRGGAQGGDRQGLGFAPGEDRRAVGAAQQADFPGDGPDVAEAAAVDAALLRQHHVPHQLFLHLRNEALGFFFPAFHLRAQGRQNLLLYLVHG